MNEELYKDLLKTMLKIRYFEQAAKKLYAEGLILGSIHLYTGEEAIAAGACAALCKDDFITSTHRGHGHIIAKGGDLNKIMSELLGKATGYNGGRGGSMHIATTDLGILGANGIVGAGIPLATGAALSAKLRKSGQVTVCFFGDGASNQGTFHESLNIASVFSLPVVYICENNLYGVGTCILNTSKCINISERSKSYAMEGVTIDGNDPVIVYSEVKKAADKARKGNGPTLIEAKTYRWNSHFEGEPDNYRPAEEVKAWKKKEPIQRFENLLIDKNIMTKEGMEILHSEIKKDIDIAVKFAKESPDPLTEDALKFVIN